MGLEVPSHSLGYAHLGLLALLLALVGWRPAPTLRFFLLGVGFALTLILPIIWVGPAWSETPELQHFAWGFFVSFASSLGIPFACGATAVTILERRRSPPGRVARLGWTIGAYILGLLLSFPVSFNYALAYPLLR